MPDFEEKNEPNVEEFRQKIESRALEMGITFTFSQYIEQMESYLLELEERVKVLEKRAGKG